jgi:hypothetical protein
MSVVAPVRRRQTVLVAATLVCAASMLVLGAWAFLAPESFSSHALDRQIGGHDSDVPSLGLLTLIALLALWERLRWRKP